MCSVAFAQSSANALIAENIKEIISSEIPPDKKLIQLYDFKKDMDNSKAGKDSFYAKLLCQIGEYEIEINKNYNKVIENNLQALRINISGEPGSSVTDAARNSMDLAYYYEKIGLLNTALTYYDSAVLIAQKRDVQPKLILYSKLRKSNLLFLTGDYQKSSEESFAGEQYAIKQKDSSYYLEFLNQKAQAYFFQNQISYANKALDEIIKLSEFMKDRFQLASAYKIKGMIYEKQQNFPLAESYFKKSIQVRLPTRNIGQIASDYNELGNFYSTSENNFLSAKINFFKAIEYAQQIQNSIKLSMININLGELSLKQQDYKNSSNYFIKALQYLKVKTDGDILTNPLAKELNLIGNKDFVITIMIDKAKLLLHFFSVTNNPDFLNSSIKTAMVADSVITQTRHEQSGEQSKLYWRNRTREFFTNSLEACYLAGDAKNAFYFMEKSRAVLLNDKLNELGANAQLSASDAQQEQDFQIKIIAEQQKLNDLTVDTKAYKEQQLKLFAIKDDFEHFTKLLEKKYPTYYEYKYADAVPLLTDLQKNLTVNHQSFVHYFMNDTVMYILSITPVNAKIAKLSKNEFDFAQVNNFLQYCSSKSLLNTNYKSFATLSNYLYKSLFQRLQLPKGRVVICSDNFLIPFEALCSDINGKQFLIYDYNFSYVYSATYLMKNFKAYPSNGNFIGFAPVSFQNYLDVASLIQSETALKKSADNYNNSLLLTNEAATKKNFIQKIAGYSVVNVFSHASADSTYTEPRIYMQDSVVKLSDLQLLNKPAARLVVLSACQTNVGKNATGEGIYSLARGFASAGIPSVAATLWNADEDMIYEVSATFHEHLAQGMSKDSALQKAKLDFINNHKGSEKLLPYYWANMVLIGNTEPLSLSTGSNRWWLICGVVLILTAVFMQVRKESKAK